MIRSRATRLSLTAILSLALSSCASVPTPTTDDRGATLFPRSSIEPKDVEKAIQFELALKKHYEKLAPRGKAWFEVLEGDAPIIVSAPHATQPVREGASHEFADSGTGSLAVALHELTGATVIYTSYKSPSDPNYYDDNPYKAALAALLASKKPRLVLDLHASHPNRPYDVDFGTMGGASLLGDTSLLSRLADDLRREGLTNFSQDRFAASLKPTVTKFVVARGVPCIQLEISSTWTTTEKDSDWRAHRFAQVLEGLTRFIRDVAPSPSKAAE